MCDETKHKTSRLAVSSEELTTTEETIQHILITIYIYFFSLLRLRKPQERKNHNLT